MLSYMENGGLKLLPLLSLAELLYFKFGQYATAKKLQSFNYGLANLRFELFLHIPNSKHQCMTSSA